MAVIGRSGTSKTPGLDAVRKPLRLIDEGRQDKIQEMRRRHETKVESAKMAEANWKAALKDAIDSNSAPPEKPPEATTPIEFATPRLYLSSVTIERVPALLQSTPRGLLCIYDELASFLLNMRRYSNGEDDSFWLEAWNGGPYTVERQKGSCRVDHLLVGITGGLQPDVLSSAFDGDHNGMYACFCFGWPKEPSYRPLSDEVTEIEPAIVNALTRLIDLPSEGEFAHRTIPFSWDARKRFEEFRRYIDDEKKRLDGRERDWLAKGPAHVVRLAGTLTYLEWANPGRRSTYQCGKSVQTTGTSSTDARGDGRAVHEPDRDEADITGAFMSTRPGRHAKRRSGKPYRHPEVAAKRPSKDAAEAPGPSPFEARRYAPSTSG